MTTRPATWLLCFVLGAGLAPDAIAADVVWWERTREAATEAWDKTLRWVAGDPGDQPHLADIWEDLVPKLDATLDLVEETPRLPESSWFGRDRREARTEIDALLDEAAEILGQSPTSGVRARIRALEERIEALQRENDAYRLKKVAAPRDSLWRKTVEEYDQAIEDNEAEIDALRGQLKEEKAAFAQMLRQMGLDVEDEDLDVLLSSVVGDDLIEMAVVFDNIKQITGQLERLMAESGERMAAARRYYGMYTVLLRILIHMHEAAMDKIERQYLPRIEAISTRTGTLRKETRALLRRARKNRAVLEANLRAQELTLEAARQYRDYLRGQHAELGARLAGLRKDLEVAWNTYETVKVSGELLALMRASQASLQALSRLEMPKLKGFENPQLREEFQRLTEQLRVGT